LQHARDRIEPRAQLLAIGFHVLDRTSRNVGVHRGFRHRWRNIRDQPRIERHRDDVIRPVFRPRAVGGRNLVRYVLTRQRRKRARRSNLHFHVDGAGAHVERAAEDVGETEYVVDLIRIVGAAGRHDGIAAHFGDFLDRYFRIGIGHGEDDRLVRHRLHHVLGHRAFDRKAEEHVGTGQRFGERACRSLHRIAGLPLVHAIGTAFVDDALGVAKNEVLRAEADGAQQLKASDAGRAGAIANDFSVFDFAARQFQRVDQAGGSDNCGAVLVVMEHRNVEQLTQLLLDNETLRRLDVFEVDAAPALAQELYAIDEFVGIFGRDFEIDGVDVGEALEQHRLAFHHRLGCERTAIAQTEDRSAVGDHRNEIALGGVIVGLRFIFGDRQHRYGNARRISQRKVSLGRHRLRSHDFEFSRPALAVKQ
jgi:hypothetical protein